MSNTNKRNTSKKQEDTDEEQQLVNIDKPIELLQKWLKYDKPRNVLLSQMTKRGTGAKTRGAFLLTSIQETTVWCRKKAKKPSSNK